MTTTELASLLTPDDTAEPTVSIVLPTHTEIGFIRDCLDSILAQDYPAIVEVLVVDGGSQDGTRDVVADATDPIRLVDNPRVTAAAAMNIGIDEAVGDVIVRMDAHALYAPDYVRRCIEVLVETGAANVGGLMRPLGVSAFGRAVAAATSTPWGVGPGAFHYADERRDVDTVFLGCYWRSALIELGGYDEENLQWAAEDHELNFRLTQKGGRITLDPLIRSVYFPRSSPAGLSRQYRNYGIGKMSTLWKHRRLPTWRPLVPAALVVSS
ncbi:MAG: glycosyltransferase family 2 protein, partial [Acidimicrobiia bacterium]|nr:glycosyltransferase family 2 protein [Acidimicrobiia bacterium]